MATARVQQGLRLAHRLCFQPNACSPALRSGYAQQAQLSHSTSLLQHFQVVASGAQAGAFASCAQAGAAPLRTPCIWLAERGYAKKAKAPIKQLPARVKAKPAQSRPLVQPSEASSVKNRNHKKRMLQRAEFAKKQAQDTIKAVRLSIARRDSARVKRWKEGAERARAWAQLLASRKQPRSAVSESVAVAQ